MDGKMWTFAETEQTLKNRLEVIKTKNLGGLSWSTHIGDDVFGTICDQGKMPLLKNSSRILQSFGPFKGKIKWRGNKQALYKFQITKSARYVLFPVKKGFRV